MQLNKDKYEFLNQTIDDWRQSGNINELKAQELKSTFSLKKFNWQAVVVYTFVIAVVSAVLSVIVLLSDRPLRAWIEKLTAVSDTLISIILSVFTIVAFILLNKQRQKAQQTASYMAFMLFACFLSTASVAFWAKSFHVFANHYAGVFLIAAILYGIIAVYFRTQVVWVLMGLMYLFAFGLYTYKYQSAEGYWLNFNIPVRFLLFSLLILPFYLVLKKSPKLIFAVKAQYIFGCVLFYLALWLCSIFGNHASLDRWNHAAQSDFIIYAVILFVVSLAGIYYGVKKQNTALSGISLVFFVLNLITRYFEYFWKPLNKSLFFLILAVIFWIAGMQIEKYMRKKGTDTKNGI